MKIAVDIMGGDFAPAEPIKGVQLFLDEVQDADVHLLLIGNMDAAAPYMHLLEAYQYRYTFIEAPQVIDMHEHPTKALKEKPQSSISIGFGLLQQNKSDAFIGAGNTGAMLVGSMYSVKAIKGILRPTIASPIPKITGKYNLLLDVGANADCKPENLLQFAELGSLYAEHIYGIKNPRVALLNLGEEEGKGNLLSQATYPLLKENTNLNFVGNVEGRDLFLDTTDVIVCEGFVGNVALKMAESIYTILKDQRKIEDDFINNFNYEIHGGTPILGINSTVIIGHGISHSLAFKNMIIAAYKMINSHIIEAFKSHFSSANI